MKEKVLWNIDKAKEEFAKRGLTLLEKEFKNVDYPMECIALCGHNKKLSLSNLLIEHGYYCKPCGHKNRSKKRLFTYEYVKQYFEDKGCKLLSTEYSGTYSKLKYIASCGHEEEITFTKFKSGHGIKCKKCCMPKGKEHHAFNPELSLEERLQKRDYWELIQWRLDVYKRDNYTCICCNDDKGGNLNAHHLNGYNWDIINRLNIDNGVTMCEKCHNNFHKIYGFGNNTKEQFNEWICEYRGNLIDSERL